METKMPGSLEKRASQSRFGLQAGSQKSLPRLWPYLALCACVAAFLDVSHLHQGEQADSIIPVLVSLQRWTFYYWGQDRYGMLLPLLALPFRDPLYNLLAQAWMTTFGALAAFFLLSRYLVRNTLWPVVATAAIACVITVMPPVVQFDWFVSQPYAVPFTLVIASLLLVENRPGPAARVARFSVALLLSVLANWINSSASLVFMPLLFLCWLQNGVPAQFAWEIRRGKLSTRTWVEQLGSDSSARGLGVLVFGLLSSLLTLHFVKHRVTELGGLPIREWLNAWSQLADNAWHNAFPSTPRLICLLALGFFSAIVLLRARGEQLKNTRQIATPLIGAALIWWLFMGTRVWVQMNGYANRYLIPSLFFLVMLIAVLAIGVVPESLGQRSCKYMLFLSAVVLLSLDISHYGWPSLATVRADLDQRFGRTTPDLLAAHANLVAGNYWTIWPAVFQANLALYERGEHRAVYGLGLRSGPTRRFWSQIPLDRVRVAVPISEKSEGKLWLHEYGFRVRSIGHRATIDVFVPCPPGSAPYTPGETISFGQNGNSDIYEAEGWSEEERGAWTLDRRSTLLLNLAETPRTDLLLTFKAYTFLAPRRLSFGETVKVNGSNVYEWVVSNQHIEKQVLVPRALVQSHLLRIEFIDHDPKSPADVGVSIDGRKLGLYLQTLKIVSVNSK